MNKGEHYRRIVQSIKAHEAHDAGLSAIDALADECAGLWAIVDDAGSAEADGLWRLVNRVQVAELSREAALADNARLTARAAAAERERDEDAANARRLLDIRDDRLTRIHRALTEPGALEKIAAILSEPAELAERAARVRAGQSQGKPADEVFESLGRRLDAAGLADLWTDVGRAQRTAQARAIRAAAANLAEAGDPSEFVLGFLYDLADRVERGEVEVP